MDNISLFGNMMFLNEAVFLPEVILALQQIVDVLVIQDNGSTDMSSHISASMMRRKQDIYIETKQTDPPNYSDLRNNMLSFVPNGAWVLKWDADELPSTGMIKLLRKYIEEHEEGHAGFTVPCYHLMKDIRECLPMEVGFGHMCLFKKTPHTLYAGNVHEQVVLDGGVGTIQPETGIAIIHFSYFAERRLQKKAERYAQTPSSGFTKPEDLTNRLRFRTVPLPEYISWSANKDWIEQIRISE